MITNEYINTVWLVKLSSTTIYIMQHVTEYKLRSYIKQYNYSVIHIHQILVDLKLSAYI